MSEIRLKSNFGCLAALLATWLLLGEATAAEGQSTADQPAKDPTSATAAESGPLNESEASLNRRYKQFEQTLLQMAEYLRKTEPERADLLVRAIGKSKEDRIGLQLEQIMDLLKNEQLGDAIGREQHLVANLKGLLELLQSEDRRHQLDEEKKWLESVREEIGKLSVREKELRRATESQKKPDSLAERQSKVGRDAQSLEQKIDKQDAARNAANRVNPSGKQSPKSGEGRDSKAKDKNKKDEKDKKGEAGKPESDRSSKPDEKGENQPGDKQSPGKSGDKSQKGKQAQKGSKQSKQSPEGKNPSQQPPSQDKGDGSPEDSSSDQSQNDSSPQQMKKTPGREEIEEARRAMQKAEEELKHLQRDKALERQDEAIRKLAQAKERLEKILRQLREEEQEIMLTSLEARIAKMLLNEIQLHVDTVTLGKTAKNAWTATHFGKARELSVQQETIADEAGRALTLLKEEGSSVAFPQGVEQIRDDMVSIVRRLGKNDVGEFTQSIEKDVIESLEELVTALQSEIENRKKPEAQRQRRQKSGSGNDENEKQLVEQIAELKMLRSLQLRVNRRTKEIGRRIHGEQATADDLAMELQRLARRQAEIQEATYIIASGRNR
jgi:hypothetical protein